MKRILAIFICVMLVCTTIVVPAVSADVSYEDYVPGEKPANMYVKDNGLTGAWQTDFDRIHPDHAGGIPGVMRYPIVAKPQYWTGSNAVFAITGGDMTQSFATGLKFKANTNYVIYSKLRNGAAATVDGRFGYMIRSNDASNSCQPAHIELITVKDDGVNDLWQEYKAVLHVDYDGTSKSGVYYGFPNDSAIANKQGTEIQHKIGSFYMAEEVPYDLTVQADKTVMAEGVDTIGLELQILNQIDMEYTGESTIEWYVLNADRTEKVLGFDIVSSADGKRAEISAAKGKVSGGKYFAVAEDKLAANGFRRGVEFTVIPYYSADLGIISTRAKLNTEDSEWSADSVTTGLVTKAIVEATLTDKDGDFKWYALDEDRINKVDGFTFDIVKEANKETATVSLANTINEGTYYIVAESADGTSLAGQKLIVDKSDDLVVIKDTIASKNKTDIEAGLNTTHLDILELTDCLAAKADKTALAAILAGAAEDEKIKDANNLKTLQEIVERLALVSMYNVSVEGVELTDENGGFKYADALKISDADDVTINSVFNAKATADAKAKVMASVTGKGYTTWSDFASDAKEAMLLNTLAYPNVNGIGYVSELLTEDNLTEIGIDPANYIALEDKDAFNNSIASELLTFDELKKKIEGAKASEDEEEDTSSSKKNTGGGGFAVQKDKDKEEEKEEEKEDTTVITPETYSFADVPESHWAYADIHYLKSIGVVDGVSENTYAPNANVTREQFLKLIIEAFGIEMKDSSVSFADVKSDAWYAPYVAAGVENGIINGVDETTFGTGKPISRQDACTIIARALKLEGATEGDLGFTDADSISSYARAAVSALSGYAVINGMGDGSFAPNAVCTRAQAAKIVSATIGIVNALNADGR